MADLLVSGGDTDRPWDRDARAAAQASSSSADDGSRGGVPATARDTFSIAEVPDWVLEQVDRVAYPTRMARRRALEAAQVQDRWEPDPWVTPPLLGRVEDELGRLLGRRYDPFVPEQPDGAAASDGAGEPGETVESGASADAVEVDQRDESGVEPTRPDGTDLLPTASGRLGGRLGRVRRHRLVAAATALAVVAAGAAVVALTRPDGHGSGGAAAAAAAPRQQVVALALTQSDELTGISLLAAGGEQSPQQVLVPSRLLLDVPGGGRLPLAESLAPGRSAPGAALADALDIRVAGTWVLSGPALATLVDSVGGITADVDVDVTRGRGAGAAIVVPQGAGQRLTGAQAAAYAQLLVGDEPEAARLARQERVVTALLGALPADRAQRRAVLVGLPDAPTGPTLDAVVALTGSLRDAAAKQALPSTVLPVRDIDAGGDVTAYGLDTTAAATLVQARLPGAVVPVPAGGRLRVLVQNGDGRPGLGDTARSQLVAAGLKYLGGGNVPGFGVDETVVLLPDGSSTSRAMGSTVLAALGLPESALRISDSAQTVADVVVVLGADFGRG